MHWKLVYPSCLSGLRYLLCKHGFRCEHPHKKQAQQQAPVIPALTVKTRGLADLSPVSKSKVSENLPQKHEVGSGGGHLMFTSGLHTCTSCCVHTHPHTTQPKRCAYTYTCQSPTLFVCFLFVPFFETGSLCPGTHFIDKAGLELL